jgi:hypothetical protein
LTAHPVQRIGAIFRADAQFGGGKTHMLIATAHAARRMSGVANVAEFVSRTCCPGNWCASPRLTGKTPIP